MMRCLLISLCGLVVLAQAAPHTADFAEEWRLFKAIHGKEYDSAEEEAIRMNIYLENKNKIEKHNEDFRKNLVSYTLGINKFADMLSSEMAAFKGFKMEENSPAPTASFMMLDNSSSLPSTVDWRTKGAVTDVKNQGLCGSCWAFSANGALEGQLAIKTGKLVSLSAQQLLECDKVDEGCNGGLPSTAFKYIKDAGIESEKAYPYRFMTMALGATLNCTYDASKVVTKVGGFVAIKTGSEDALKQAVATVGPISVGIDASQSSFQNYRSGVYNEPACSSTELDHGVLAVGYGTTSAGVDYWLVKNSWGPGWGDGGYLKMSRNKNNQCGIATDAIYPIV